MTLTGALVNSDHTAQSTFIERMIMIEFALFWYNFVIFRHSLEVATVLVRIKVGVTSARGWVDLGLSVVFSPVCVICLSSVMVFNCF